MDTTKTTITLIAMLRGIGLGFAMMPVNTAAMNAVPRHLFGKATALSTTVRSITQALAITFMTTIISNKSSYYYARLTEQITPFNQTSNHVATVMQGVFMKSGLSQGDAHGAALSTMGKMLYAQAYLDSMNYAVALTVPAVAVAIILVLMMSSKKTTKKNDSDKSLVKEKVTHESEAGVAGSME
jgi:uncharacterized membrane protein